MTEEWPYLLNDVVLFCSDVVIFCSHVVKEIPAYIHATFDVALFWIITKHRVGSMALTGDVWMVALAI